MRQNYPTFFLCIILFLSIALLSSCSQTTQCVGCGHHVIQQEEITFLDATINATLEFYETFNPKKDTVNLTLALHKQEKDSQIKDVRILSTEFTKSINTNRNIWHQFPVEIQFIATHNDTESLHHFPLNISFQFQLKNRSRMIHIYHTDLKMQIRNQEANCTECNDNNECTKDICIPNTGLCQHIIQPMCVGNFRCEHSENKCNAPVDCGPCEGEGEFTIYKCTPEEEKEEDVRKEITGIDKTCKVTLKEPAKRIEKTKDIGIPSSQSPDLQFRVHQSQPNPLNPLTEKIELKFQVLNKKEGIQNIQIHSVDIKDERIINRIAKEYTFLDIGYYNTYKFPLTSRARFNEPEQVKEITVEFRYSYDKVNNIGTIESINNQLHSFSLGEVALFHED